MERVNATMEKIRNSEKLLRDGEAALKAKREKAMESERESKAMESDIQALHEQVQKHNENLKTFWEEMGKGQTLIAEFTDEISTATVNAEARFSAGSDFLTMKITLYLVPPPEFRSGTYEGNVGGKPVAGETDASSVMYFGGQADQPSLGGVFIFKDEQNRPLYRVRIPATPMSRR